MASRSLDDLRPQFRARAIEWLAACKAAGMDPLVYCTLRSIAEQDALYAQSRTKPGKRVTNAKGGSSAHNFGYALDFVPLIGGKPNWTPGSNHYLRCVRIAEECGMESASKWKSLKEWPHLQEPNWRSIVQ